MSNANAFSAGDGSAFIAAPGNARGARNVAGLFAWKTDGIKIAQRFSECVEWSSNGTTEQRAILYYHPDEDFPGVTDAAGYFPFLMGDGSGYTASGATLADFTVGEYVELKTFGASTYAAWMTRGKVYPAGSANVTGTIASIGTDEVTIGATTYQLTGSGFGNAGLYRNGNYLTEGVRINNGWWVNQTDEAAIRRDFGGRTGYYFASGFDASATGSQWIRGMFRPPQGEETECTWGPMDPLFRTHFQIEVFYPDNGDDVEVRVFGILHGLTGRLSPTSNTTHEVFAYLKIFEATFDPTDPATEWADPVSGPIDTIVLANTLACADVGDAFDFGFPEDYFPLEVQNNAWIVRAFTDRIGGADGTVTLYPAGTTVTSSPAVAAMCSVTLPSCNNGCGDPPPWDDTYLYYRAVRCGVREFGKHVYVRLPEDTDIYGIRWRGCRNVIHPGRETFPPDAILAQNYQSPRTSATEVDGCTLFNADTECPATFTLTRCDDEEIGFVTTSPLYDQIGLVVRLDYQPERTWTVAQGGAGNDRSVIVLEEYDECQDVVPCECNDDLETITCLKSSGAVGDGNWLTPSVTVPWTREMDNAVSPPCRWEGVTQQTDPANNKVVEDHAVELWAADGVTTLPTGTSSTTGMVYVNGYDEQFFLDHCVWLLLVGHFQAGSASGIGNIYWVKEVGETPTGTYRLAAYSDMYEAGQTYGFTTQPDEFMDVTEDCA